MVRTREEMDAESQRFCVSQCGHRRSYWRRRCSPLENREHGISCLSNNGAEQSNENNAFDTGGKKNTMGFPCSSEMLA